MLLFPTDDQLEHVIWEDPPASAPLPHLEHLVHPVHGPAADVWWRHNAGGQVIGGQVRFMTADGRKEDRQFRWGRVGAERGWVQRAGPKPWPIFGLDELASRPDSPVLVVEGPKARQAAADHFPGHVCVCGTGALMTRHFDWTALRGRRVTIWPDNDPAGFRFAKDIGALLVVYNSTYRQVQLPPDAPSGWDLADSVNGWNLGELLDTAIPMEDFDHDPIQIKMLNADAQKLFDEVGEDEEEEADGYDDRSPVFYPDEFWDSMPVLRQISDWCWTHRFPRDSTLLCAMTRIAAMMPGHAIIETGVGMPSPPILFGCILADSGGGKSVAQYAAKRLVPVRDGLDMVDGAMPGSGEGFEGAFCSCDTKTGLWTQVRHNGWFSVDEGEIMEIVKAKAKASTWGPKLRQFWTGQVCETQLAKCKRKVANYSIGVMCNMQFETMAALLAEDKLGTPGRFVYCSAGDPYMPYDRLQHFARPDLSWYPDDKFTLHPDIAYEVDLMFWKRMTLQDGLEAIDGQRILNRVRVAAILASMNERSQVSVRDYEIACMLMKTSDNIRKIAFMRVRDMEDAGNARVIQKAIRSQFIGRLGTEQGMNNTPWAAMVGTVARRCKRMCEKGEVFRRVHAQKSLKANSMHTESVLMLCTEIGYMQPGEEPGTFVPGKLVIPPKGQPIIPEREPKRREAQPWDNFWQEGRE